MGEASNDARAGEARCARTQWRGRDARSSDAAYHYRFYIQIRLNFSRLNFNLHSLAGLTTSAANQTGYPITPMNGKVKTKEIVVPKKGLCPIKRPRI